MEYYNIYELLYMYHSGDQYACKLIEEQMRSWMNKWIYEKVETNRALLSQYVQELQQEALLGLYDAMDTYRTDKDTGFLTFLKVVLDRRMQNFIRTLKEQSVYDVSIDEEINNGKDKYILKDILENKNDLSSPEYALHFLESCEILKDIMDQLKAKERDVLYAWVESDSQQEAAAKLNLSSRSFGAKLRRSKLKVREAYLKKTG